MQTTRFPKSLRTALVTGSLLAALAVGSAAADSTRIGLTECDHGCKIEALKGSGNDRAEFQVTGATPVNLSGYVSNGPGELGFIR